MYLVGPKKWIMTKCTFLFVSMPSITTLRQAPRVLPDGSIIRDTTVFFRELKMLIDAGYIQKVLQDGRIVMMLGG